MAPPHIKGSHLTPTDFLTTVSCSTLQQDASSSSSFSWSWAHTVQRWPLGRSIFEPHDSSQSRAKGQFCWASLSMQCRRERWLIIGRLGELWKLWWADSHTVEAGPRPDSTTSVPLFSLIGANRASGDAVEMQHWQPTCSKHWLSS